MTNIELINDAISKATTCAHPETNAVTKSMLNREIQAAIGYRSEINVECINGVVILSGYFANENDKNRALRKAISNPGVQRVINDAN